MLADGVDRHGAADRDGAVESHVAGEVVLRALAGDRVGADLDDADPPAGARAALERRRGRAAAVALLSDAAVVAGRVHRRRATAPRRVGRHVGVRRGRRARAEQERVALAAQALAGRADRPVRIGDLHRGHRLRDGPVVDVGLVVAEPVGERPRCPIGAVRHALGPEARPDVGRELRARDALTGSFHQACSPVGVQTWRSMSVSSVSQVSVARTCEAADAAAGTAAAPASRQAHSAIARTPPVLRPGPPRRGTMVDGRGIGRGTICLLDEGTRAGPTIRAAMARDKDRSYVVRPPVGPVDGSPPTGRPPDGHPRRQPDARRGGRPGRRSAPSARDRQADRRRAGDDEGAATKLGQVMSFLDVGLVPEEFRQDFQAKLAELREPPPRCPSRT